MRFIIVLLALSLQISAHSSGISASPGDHPQSLQAGVAGDSSPFQIESGDNAVNPIAMTEPYCAQVESGKMPASAFLAHMLLPLMFSKDD